MIHGEQTYGPESPQQYLDRLRLEFDINAANLGVTAATAFVNNPQHATAVHDRFKPSGIIMLDAKEIEEPLADVISEFAHNFVHNQPHNEATQELIDKTDASGKALSEALLSGQFLSKDLQEIFFEEKAQYDPEKNRTSVEPSELYESIKEFHDQFASDASTSVVNSLSNAALRVAGTYREIIEKTNRGSSLNTRKHPLPSNDHIRGLMNGVLPFTQRGSSITQAQLEALIFEPGNRVLARVASGKIAIDPEGFHWPDIMEEINDSYNYVEVRDQIFSSKLRGCPAGKRKLLDKETLGQQTAIEIVWPWAVDVVSENMAASLEQERNLDAPE